MKTFLTLFFALACVGAFGQNLVRNGRFNQIISCPAAENEIDKVVGWSGTDHPVFGKGEAFHTCSGFTTDVSIPVNIYGNQSPKIGDGYGGFIAYSHNIEDARNYLVVELTQTVLPGTMVTFDISWVLASGSLYRAPFGIKFINLDVGEYPLLSPDNLFTGHLITPASHGSGTNTWYNGALTSTFTITDTATHIAIGNFMDDANSRIETTISGFQPIAYIYIDEVRLDLVPTGMAEAETPKPIYPNPGTAGTVPNTPEGFTADFYTLRGQHVAANRLTPGMYTYTLAKGTTVHRGRYVVN